MNPTLPLGSNMWWRERKPRYNFRPHDKANAKARRLRQIAKGQLTVEGITPDQAASRLLALVSKTRAA